MELGFLSGFFPNNINERESELQNSLYVLCKKAGAQTLCVFLFCYQHFRNLNELSFFTLTSKYGFVARRVLCGVVQRSKLFSTHFCNENYSVLVPR